MVRNNQPVINLMDLKLLKILKKRGDDSTSKYKNLKEFKAEILPLGEWVYSYSRIGLRMVLGVSKVNGKVFSLMEDIPFIAEVFNMDKIKSTVSKTLPSRGFTVIYTFKNKKKKCGSCGEYLTSGDKENICMSCYSDNGLID